MKFKANNWFLALYIAIGLACLLLCMVFGALTFAVWYFNRDSLEWLVPAFCFLFMVTLLVFGVPSFYRTCYYSVEVNKERGEICIHYALTGKNILVKFTDVKGYSNTDDVRTSIISKKLFVTLYLVNGEKIDLNKYQFRQFPQFEKLLETLRFPFLGTEPYNRDLWGNRINYKY